MNLRSVLSMTTVALSAVLLSGCPEDAGNPSATGTAKPQPTTPKTGGPATSSAGPTNTAKVEDGGGDKFGPNTIKVTVKFTGTAPEMKVPKKRGEAELCKDKPVVYNAVVAKDGKLQDVWVGVADGQLKGEYTADQAATLDQHDCMYTPRIQGGMPEQDLMVKNSDQTLHNVNAGKGAATLFNTAQPKGAPDLKKSFEETGVYRFKCDVHSWMRSFMVVSDNPFYGVTGADGTASIAKVPNGKLKVMAWHSQYGAKEQEVDVKGGEVAVEFTYDGTEKEPAENQGELNDLF